jgi:hypothetical protein
MAFQSPNLIMTGRGIPDTPDQTLLNSPLTIPRGGIHLRWFFDKSRGFAKHGYYIYRRAHAKAKAIELYNDPLESRTSTSTHQNKRLVVDDFGTFKSDGVISHLPDVTDSAAYNIVSVKRWQSLRFDISQNLESMQMSLSLKFDRRVNNLPLKVYQWDRLIEQQNLQTDSESKISLNIAHDTISSIVIGDESGDDNNRTLPLMKIIEHTYYPVKHSYSIPDPPGEWEFLQSDNNPVLLPLADDNYKARNSPASYDDAFTLADNRSSAELDDNFESLHDDLAKLFENDDSIAMDLVEYRDTAFESENNSGARFSLGPLKVIDVVLSQVFNPSYAQALGVYFIDESAQVGVAYDYLIIAAFGEDISITGPRPDSETD